MPSGNSLSRNKLRNLKQYRDMPDAEFDELFDKKRIGIEQNEEFEKRIGRKLDEFSKDYDVENLKANDLLTLRTLAQAYITLEDYEHLYYNMRSQGLDLSMIIEFKNLSDMMSTLRSDISKMQTDLGISRKSRKGEKEETVISELERLKTAARTFYEQKMFYVFCPKCNTLLCTAWFLYPEEKNNKLVFTCNATPDGENLCNHKFFVTSKELLDKRGTNSTNIPDGLK